VSPGTEELCGSLKSSITYYNYITPDGPRQSLFCGVPKLRPDPDFEGNFIHHDKRLAGSLNSLAKRSKPRDLFTPRKLPIMRTDPATPPAGTDERRSELPPSLPTVQFSSHRHRLQILPNHQRCGSPLTRR
jgi:hypothetical protein